MGIKEVANMKIIEFLEETLVPKEKAKNQNASLILSGLYLAKAVTTIMPKILEPYIPTIFSMIMPFFGDTSSNIRDLSIKITKHTMSNLSSHGVNIAIPMMIKGTSLTYFY